MTPEQRLATDFPLFLRLLWRSLNLPSPTPAQLYIADYLVNGPNRKQIRAFRGIGKSWVTAAFALWRLYGNVDRKIMVVSASKQRADDFTMFCQSCIANYDWLQHLEPTSDDQRWSRVSFDVRGAKPAQSPSLKSVGITGQITGSRANDVIFDDVEVPGNSATDVMREKLLNLIEEGENVLLPLPDSTITFLGTPQTIFTVYKTLEDRHYVPIIWPARYPSEDRLHVYGDYLAEPLQNKLHLVGQPTDTRFSDHTLREREMSMARSTFMLQFQLDTSLSDSLKFPLKLENIPAVPLDADEGPVKVVWRADKDHQLNEPAVGLPGDRWYRPGSVSTETEPWVDTILAVDPSGRGADETVGMILSQLKGRIFLRAMFTTTDGYSAQTMRSLLLMAKQYGAKTAVVESNFGDGMFVETMKRYEQDPDIKYGLAYEEVRQSVRKEDRILDTLELITEQHRLVIDQRLIKQDYHTREDLPMEERLQRMMMYQLTRMCREKGAVKHDDRADCLAIGVKHFTDRFAMHDDMLIERDRREELEATMDALDRHAESALFHMAIGVPVRRAKKAVASMALPR